MKGYDLKEVEKGRAVVGQDLRRLLQKLTDNEPADTIVKNDEPAIIISRA